ncbi:MAG TPA: porin family protein [Chitinophagaceae bacterium]
MKSKLLCVALLVIAASAPAQKFRQNVSFGPIVGLGHAWMTGFDGNKEFKLAPSAGVTMVYSAGAHWGFGFDAKFSREGVKLEEPLPGTESVLHANYIRMPFKALYFFGELGDKARPKIFAGPTLGYLIGGKQKLKTTGGETLAATKTKEVLDRFDLGIQGGLGLNVRLTRNTWLNTDVSYYSGLRNVSKDNSYKWKNRHIAATVGVAFGIGTITE